jgi:hypothetical protein
MDYRGVIADLIVVAVAQVGQKADGGFQSRAAETPADGDEPDGRAQEEERWQEP